MSFRNEDTRCKGLTKRGKPCRAAATASGLCFFHSNPAKASELGRIGGRKNRHAYVGVLDPLPILANEFAVRDAVSRVAADLYAGRIPPKTAASLALLLYLQLRAFEALDEAEKAKGSFFSSWRWASEKPEISNVRRPENSSSVSPEISSVRESESPPRAGESEISKVKESEITGGSWQVMGNLDEPEVSSEKEPEISSAPKATISKEGKLEILSAESPDLSRFVQPVLPMEKIAAMSRERQRRFAIADAQAARLSDDFEFDDW